MILFFFDNRSLQLSSSYFLPQIVINTQKIYEKITDESNFSLFFVFSATSIVRSRPLRENPIPVAREKSISHSSTSSNEENLLSSGSKSSAAANLVDPYALISKTSASEFRKNNDSISSNTTNEDIDEDEDFNYCDSNEQQVRQTLQIFTEIIKQVL